MNPIAVGLMIFSLPLEAFRRFVRALDRLYLGTYWYLLVETWLLWRLASALDRFGENSRPVERYVDALRGTQTAIRFGRRLSAAELQLANDLVEVIPGNDLWLTFGSRTIRTDRSGRITAAPRMIDCILALCAKACIASASACVVLAFIATAGPQWPFLLHKGLVLFAPFAACARGWDLQISHPQAALRRHRAAFLRHGLHLG